jgi:hypothetical protein
MPQSLARIYIGLNDTARMTTPKMGDRVRGTPPATLFRPGGACVWFDRPTEGSASLRPGLD